MRDAGIAVRSNLRIFADPSRVITRLFIPGKELVGGSEARTSETIARVLALSESDVSSELNDLTDRFSKRHEDIEADFDRNAQRVSDYLVAPISPTRRQLLGAAFTHEYSLEGASVCNPSLVAHPDQVGVDDGALRVVMSYRSIGEGHLSCICFRTGEIDAAGTLRFDEPHPFPVAATTSQGPLRREVFRAKLRDSRFDDETAALILMSLPARFSTEQLDAAITRPATHSDTRQNVAETAGVLRSMSERFYVATFARDVDLSRRVLWPSTAGESAGVEDARFVKIEDDDLDHYVATYTAYDGRHVSQQLLETDDFATFSSSPLAGRGAQNKGLAVFPRRVGGRFVALSRYDRESNAIAFSSDIHHWDQVSTLQIPDASWEMLQLGNCGSPIELPEGWLVITHGVGPMRTYALGALLLDLNDPTKVLARLSKPLLIPNADEQDGYVPNVVYSCGSLVHAGTLYLPYGIADQSISYCTVVVKDLLSAMR
ncbi:MAG: glycoside hydrolase family 130 protein [Acidimicrobiales bacterium]